MLYIFNKYHIDTINFSIKYNNEVVAAEPRVFDLIIYLIEHESQLISREELFEKVWNTHNVSDATLSNHIKIARNILGDDGQTQHTIKTVHGRGYQFVAEIEVLADNYYSNDKAGTGILTKRYSYIALLIIIAILTIVIYTSQFKQDSIDKATKDNSIAVLAFLDMSPQKDQEYFSDGISEEILNKLAQIPKLRVISRTSSFYFKGKYASAKSIGEQLNIAYILEGSVRKYKDKLRITVQLIDSETSIHLWSETYDKTMDNVLQIQDEIAFSVSERLKLSILSQSIATKVNPEAYSLFLQARHLTQSGTLKDLIKSELTIKKSIALDPSYAPSWHLLGFIVFRVTHGYALKPIIEGDKTSRFAADKAIKLDPNYALSYATLARIENSQKHFSKANKIIQKALDLDSKNTYILNVAAHILAYSGNLNQALKIHEKINLIDPKYYPNLLGIGFINHVLNRQELAYDSYQKFEKYIPNTEIQQFNLCIVSLAMGKNQQALEHAKKEKDPFWNLYAMNLALFAVGDYQQADILLKQFIDEGGETEQGNIARIYAFRGEVNKSFEALFKAIDLNDSSLAAVLNYPEFRKMHNDPRWQEVIRKMKFPDNHWLVKKLQLTQI